MNYSEVFPLKAECVNGFIIEDIKYLPHLLISLHSMALRRHFHLIQVGGIEIRFLALVTKKLAV